MALIKLPKNYHPSFRQRSIKPTGPIEIDWSNPITKNLVGVYANNYFQKNLVDGTATTAVNASISGNQNGLGIQVTNSSASILDLNQTFFSGSENRTVIFGGYWLDDYPDNEPNIFGQGSDGTGTRWEWRVTNTNTLRIEIGGSGFQGNLTVTAGYHVAAVKLDGTTLGDHTLFLDHEKESATGATSVLTDELSDGKFFNSVLGTSQKQLADTPMLFGYIFDRALSDAEIVSIIDDPYQVLKPAGPNVYFTVPAAGTIVNVPTGSFTYSGLAPTVIAPNNIPVPVGGYTYTGLAPQVNVTVPIPVGSYTYSGLAPQVNLTVSVPTGSYTYTGLAPIVVVGGNVTIDVPVGSYTYSGLAPQVNLTVDVPTGSYTYSGLAPQVNITVPVPSGSYTYSGLAPTVTGVTTFVEIPVGAYSFSGLAPSVIFAIDITAISSFRTLKVPFEDRTLTVNLENRTLKV